MALDARKQNLQKMYTHFTSNKENASPKKKKEERYGWKRRLTSCRLTVPVFIFFERTISFNEDFFFIETLVYFNKRHISYLMWKQVATEWTPAI